LQIPTSQQPAICLRLEANFIAEELPQDHSRLCRSARIASEPIDDLPSYKAAALFRRAGSLKVTLPSGVAAISSARLPSAFSIALV